MSDQGYRTIFAITGMLLSLGVMWWLGFGGMIPGALFGAGGAVAGGMVADRFVARRRR